MELRLGRQTMSPGGRILNPRFLFLLLAVLVPAAAVIAAPSFPAIRTPPAPRASPILSSQIQIKTPPDPAPLAAQTSPHFYNVKSEIRVEGVVQDIRLEPRYEGTAPFLILALEERTTKRLFQIEISPAWFFERDVHKGEPMKIVGSLIPSEGRPSLLIAREVQVPGETINVRDARGFPNWRGGLMQRGKRKRGG